jgi:Rnl2 family RNA ligase
MKFRKYSGIENGYREEFIDHVKNHDQFNNVTWEVSEKIDGSNYSFVVDILTNEVRPAKRSCITDSAFFGSQAVFEKYKDIALAMATCIKITGIEIDTVQIFGELCGEGIQNRVYYGEKDFKAFDIRIETTDEMSFYLDPDVVRDYCTEFGIPLVPILALNLSFTDAMLVSPTFKSTIHQDREDENFAEGTVLKPSKVLYLGNGGRVIIKNKSEKYKEKSDKKKTRKTQSWSDEMNAVYAILSQYNNENRIRSAISKLGTITQFDFGLLLKAVAVDILEDWGKENEFYPLAKKDQKTITSQLNKDVANLIRVNFLNIIDGRF